jgi:hypothetical protein
MADQWYYTKDNQRHGPVTLEQLKRLAQIGELKPNEWVWKEGMQQWVAAGQAKWLFPPPPPASAEPAQRQPAPNRSASTPTLGEKAQSLASSLANRATAAAQLAAKQAEYATISKMTLPNAYCALGKDIHGAGRFRDEFGELFAKLDGLLGRIQSLRQARPVSDQPQKLTDRAKAAAGHAADLAKAKALEMQANAILRELGQAAYQKHHAESGPLPLVDSINRAISTLAGIERDIQRLSAGGDVRLRYNPFVVGASLLFCFPAGLYFVWSHPSWIPKTKWIWTGAWVCFFVVIVAMGRNGQNGITEEFLPHKVGSTAYYDMYMLESEGNGTVMRFKHEYEPDGVVRMSLNKAGLLEAGHITWLAKQIDQVTTNQYRVADGFIQKKAEVEGMGETWEPLLKLGASAGDSWDATQGSDKSHFMVVGFSDCTLRYDGKRRASVTVRREASFDGNLAMVVDATYARGIGLVLFEAYNLKGTEKTLVSQIKLVDDGNTGSWTKSERAFFEPETAAVAREESKKGGMTKAYTVKKSMFKSLTVELSPMVGEEVSLKDFGWDNTSLHFNMTWERNRYHTSGTLPWKYVVYDKDGTKIDSNDVMLSASLRVGETVKAELWPLGDDNKKLAHKVLIHYAGE